MSTSAGKSGQNLFDQLIAELLNTDPALSLIDICLSADQKAIAAVPLRYRLIALGFIKGFSAEEVNAKLIENGCERLYARSLIEATLIYAFRNKMSYEEWKSVRADAASVMSELSSDGVLSGTTVSLNDIREYVLNNSVSENELLVTMNRTRLLQDSLSDVSMDRQKLNEFILSNVTSFCSNREKTRYYFCKYLMYFLETRKDRYLKAIESGFGKDSALEDLSVFKSVTVLSRKKHSAAEADEIISSAGISFGAIYSEFQDFYFEYTSRDWMDVLLERYGSIDSLSPKQKEALASHIRSYNSKQHSLSGMSDAEVLEWQSEQIETKERDKDEKPSYQANRSGENYLRKIIRGEIDMDRTTLMAFMLCFDSLSDVPAEHRVDLVRLDEILSGCGFPALDEGNYVDGFFSDYISSDDPITFLIEEAEIMAMSEENFYLYKTYLSSRSAATDWDRFSAAGTQ